MQTSPALPQKKFRSVRNRYTPVQAILFYGVVALFALFALVPFVILISASLSSTEIIEYEGVGLLPRGLTLDAYRVVFMYPTDMLKSYGVTILSTAAGTLLNLVLCAPVGFALSRPNFRYKKFVTIYLLFTIMFNGGFVPAYILYRNYLRIYDTMWVLFLPIAGMVGYAISFRVFYSSVPPALYESARVDGANEYVIFMRIATPLIVPGMATVLFNTVLFFWNEPSQAMIYADNIVPVALYLTRMTQYIDFLKYMQESGFAGTNLQGMVIPEQTVVYAVAIATTLPMLVVFTFFQKYFVQGLTSGSVKE